MTEAESRKEMETQTQTQAQTRNLNVIVAEIRHDWKAVNYAAKPYLDAMSQLNDVSSQYGYDSGKSIILYFLANASTWHGETAKRIKLELKQLTARK